MTWKQFQSWQAYDKLDPIGGARLDTLVASIVSTLVNLHRNTEKYPNPFPIADFVLKWGEAPPKGELKAPEPKGKTWQQLKLIGQICAAAYNIAEDEEMRKRKRRRG